MPEPEREDEAARQEQAKDWAALEREQHPTDWKPVAPRWLLVWLVGIGGPLMFGALCWMAGKNATLDDERLALIQKHASDQRWELLAQISEKQAVMAAQLRQHDDQLRQLSMLRDDVAEIRANTKALRLLAERGR